jgi:tRNA pseudouridine55 synthase
MVSAIKRDGQPLYKLARRGITVERAPRPVTIYQLALTDWQPPSLTVELTCSSGTYVRALARDLGQQLGCGAHLTGLTRLSSGDFRLNDAIALERFDKAIHAGETIQAQATTGRDGVDKQALAWHALVLPMDFGLQHFPACTLDKQDSQRVRSGQSLPAESVATPRDQLCRAYAAHDLGQKMVALLRFDNDAGLWRPHKVFDPL